MHARMGRVSFEREKADEMVSHVKDTIVPTYEGMDGFKGFTLLVDRDGGGGIGISFWESEDAVRGGDQAGARGRRGAVRASPQAGDEARRGPAGAGGGSDQGREYYEVVVDTMA